MRSALNSTPETEAPPLSLKLSDFTVSSTLLENVTLIFVDVRVVTAVTFKASAAGVAVGSAVGAAVGSTVGSALGTVVGTSVTVSLTVTATVAL